MLAAAVKDKIVACKTEGMTLKQIGQSVRLRPRTVSNVVRKWKRKPVAEKAVGKE